ncbi:MAG: DUF3276 family protein [Rikenellaceae bacterium]|nr:DUF3276 family protein [Rikenellaceae bacterium]
MSFDFSPRRDHDDYGEQICTKAVRAGKRTYFFDVKATRGDDYFLTITESRKRTNADGSASFTRHQMYLYKEDFGKFMDGLSEMVDFIKEHKPEYFEQQAAKDIDEEFEKL